MKKTSSNFLILLAVVALVLLAVFAIFGKNLKMARNITPTPNVGLTNKNDTSSTQLDKDFTEAQKSVNDAGNQVNTANQDNSAQDQVPAGL